VRREESDKNGTEERGGTNRWTFCRLRHGLGRIDAQSINQSEFFKVA